MKKSIKKFDISTKKGMQKAEKYKQLLNNKYDKVRIDLVGNDKIIVYGLEE